MVRKRIEYWKEEDSIFDFSSSPQDLRAYARSTPTQDFVAVLEDWIKGCRMDNDTLNPRTEDIALAKNQGRIEAMKYMVELLKNFATFEEETQDVDQRKSTSGLGSGLDFRNEGERDEGST